ncbi:MAG: dipeptidase PepE, partial [Acidobacteria bacterium]|nr:dipeptidase PepE [Acidobacteriota bacterium]
MSSRPRALLISNSTLFGSGYLDHAEAEICAILGKQARVLFVPYALYDCDAYAARAQKRFASMGYALEPVHGAGVSLDQADALFVGGGNTFRLVDALHRYELIHRIRQRVSDGMPYIGSSAGSIAACPTLKTTKDMPIIQPTSFEALALVPFQISPHYLDPDPASTHMGETQEERILQYLEENDLRVVGLREGSMLVVDGSTVTLKGPVAARLFERGRPPVEVNPGENL